MPYCYHTTKVKIFPQLVSSNDEKCVLIIFIMPVK